MINQSLIIAVLLVPKGTRSLPDQYKRFPDSRRQSARSLPSESNQMVNDAPLQAMTWCPYVSHGSLRFIKSIQICKHFSRADWKLVWVSSCMSGRRALECETDGRPFWSRSDSDPVLVFDVTQDFTTGIFLPNSWRVIWVDEDKFVLRLNAMVSSFGYIPKICFDLKTAGTKVVKDY